VPLKTINIVTKEIKFKEQSWWDYIWKKPITIETITNTSETTYYNPINGAIITTHENTIQTPQPTIIQAPQPTVPELIQPIVTEVIQPIVTEVIQSTIIDQPQYEVALETPTVGSGDAANIVIQEIKPSINKK
jgi:hypothetical protein